jgi:hypothetical protein
MFLSASYAKGAQLANYIGTGSPKLVLELGDNGPKWKSFTIDYQQLGAIPYSSEKGKDWSSWNVKDTAGHYYGTITLISNGTEVSFKDYKGGEGYYLEGVHFSYNKAVQAFQLTADKIYPPQGDGPFPDAPIAIPAVYPGTKDPVNLSVKGTSIVNDKGKTIILKGMVRPSLEWNKQGEYLSEADILAMKKWGINTIRLDLNQNYWFKSGPKTEQGSYKQIIDAIIYYATKNDMAVILDLHWVEDGHQSPMANKKSIDFWKEVANEYKNFGTVIFELYNEPETITKEVWLHGDTKFAGYKELYDAVRSTDAKNICIVNGVDWGYDLSFVNSQFHVEGYNIVYGSHPYNEKGQTPQGFNPSFEGVVGTYPLIFTEFGVNEKKYFPTDYLRIYKNILRYVNDHQVSYTGFAWWVDKDQPNFPALISDWSGTPINGGINIKDDMAVHAPTSLY